MLDSFLDGILPQHRQLNDVHKLAGIRPEDKVWSQGDCYDLRVGGGGSAFGPTCICQSLAIFRCMKVFTAVKAQALR